MNTWYSCKIKYTKENDEGLLKQVTDAFLIDAVSYTDAETRIYEIAEREILFNVRDNGPGVNEKLRSRLFEPFFTTKPHGVGLGLSICRNIAIAHGGNLRHETPAEGGCRFTLSLPLELIG